MSKKGTYSDKELTKMKDQKNPWVMYLVVRKNAKMSPGKLAAQSAHAATMIGLKYFEYETYPIPGNKGRYEKTRNYRDWVKEGMRKRTKKASDAKFDLIKEQFDCCVVRDAGLTEVDPGTETVLIIWPVRHEDAPEIISKLPNL